MVCHTTLLISIIDFIKYIFGNPEVNGRITRWHLLLIEYDIQYVTQKAIRGSVLADYLAHQPTKDYQPIQFDFPNKDITVIMDCETPGPDEGPKPGSWWKLVFDYASNTTEHGIGDVITSPTGYLIVRTRFWFYNVSLSFHDNKEWNNLIP